MGGWHADVNKHLKPGCVIVTSTSGARECGYWGSNNSLDMMSRGVAGIVTEGNCRDTDEVIMQKCHVACRGIGRTIIPGRVELIDVQTAVGCGGVMVRPGDIVGCDWDGCIVVPDRGGRGRAGDRRADRRRRQEGPAPALRSPRQEARRDRRLGSRRRVLQGPAVATCPASPAVARLAPRVRYLRRDRRRDLPRSVERPSASNQPRMYAS